MADIKDLLGAAVERDAVSFSQNLNDIMMEKISGAIDAKRIEIASNLYTTNEEAEDLENGEDE